MSAAPSLISDRPPRARHAIVFCADANYMPFAAHAASQIAALHPERDFDICLADAAEIALPETLAPLGLRRIRLFPGDTFDQFDLDARRNHSTYFRLLLPDLLGHEYQSILYLDADIHVEGGISARCYALTSESARSPQCAIIRNGAHPDGMRLISRPLALAMRATSMPEFCLSTRRTGARPKCCRERSISVRDTPAECGAMTRPCSTAC